MLKQLWFSACHSNSGICQAYNKFLCMFACIWDAQQLIREERSSFSKKKIAGINKMETLSVRVPRGFLIALLFFFFTFKSLFIICLNFILFNFIILCWFCHISKWICHRYTCVPHPESSSLLPPHTIPLGRPSAPAPSIQYHASNLDWRLISYMILYMFQCHSPKSSHPLPLPQSPKTVLYISVSFAVSYTGLLLPSF